MARPNVLLITLDQYRADSLGCAGHPVVRTPHLDALAADGVRFARHFAQAAPCSPGRAALYTGTYQMTNRVVANGTPLDDGFDNVARAARRAGWDPTLFGYTDTGVDPRRVSDPDDPRLSDYEGVLPGFSVGLDLPEHSRPWLEWLDGHGHSLDDALVALATEADRPAELSTSAFLTERLLDWVRRQDAPWFAHASYLRPHPPYSAAGHWSTAYHPDDLPDPVPAADRGRHWLHDALLAHPITGAPTDPAALARLRAQYWGMCSEVDDQLGRLVAGLRDLGRWDDTVVVLTADHGEHLGDHGLVEKAGFFAASYHVPAIIRDPRRTASRGTVVEHFTENVDLLPTLCELMDTPVPTQCDGVPLTCFLDGVEPGEWRDAAHWEWDWRDVLMPAERPVWDRSLESQNLAVRYTGERAYVHLGDGTWRCFDLAADPTWRTDVDDPAVVLLEAQRLLGWRARHLDRRMPSFLLRDGGIGDRPYDPAAAT